MLLAVTGRREEARKKLDELEHPKEGGSAVNAFDLAAIYAALGDRDAAFQWLDRAYDRRIIWFLKVHPAMDPLARRCALRGAEEDRAIAREVGQAEACPTPEEEDRAIMDVCFFAESAPRIPRLRSEWRTCGRLV
jgi:hypothetical protein